jgi:hypothetical protein
MGDGEMIFNFFSNVNKNKEEHMSQMKTQTRAQQIAEPAPKTASWDEARKKNIEQLRASAANPSPVRVQSNYDTPQIRPSAKISAFPNSRTEERGIPDSANPISKAHAGIPTSPPSSRPVTNHPSPGNTDLSAVFNYWKTKK